MLKKSKATPYTMQERTNIHTPEPGLPAPNRPNLKTHANMARSITLLIPNFIAIGIRRMQRVSESWESDMRAFAFCAPQVLAYSGISLKLVMKGLANPLVIWSDTPSSIENIKKMAMSFFLNREKALSPKTSTNDVLAFDFETGQAGSVNE